MKSITGRHYYNAGTKEEAMKFLVQFWPKSALRKIPKRNILGIYHKKMREILEKRENYDKSEEV